MGVIIDSLYWNARLDTSKLDQDINQAKNKFSQGSQAIQKETKDGIGKSLAFIGGMFAVVFSARLIGQFIGSIARVRGEFQKYEAVLTNTLGSGSKAQAALANIQQFAAQTPFQITELTSSFVKLANQGFTPTMDQLRSMGDLASSVGKGFDQLTEAILDASMGQWERMKEFGIKASQEGDKVTVTFKGQKTTIDNTAESIRNYILSLGDMKGVSGAMSAISKTLVGQISNLKDNVDGLLNTLGKKSEKIFSGFLSFVNRAIGGINNLVSGNYGDTTGKNIVKFRENLSKELSQVSILFDAAKKSADGTDLRKKAIDQINKIYGDYLGNLLTEKSSLDDINKAQETLVNNLIKTMAVKAKEQQLQEELNRSLEKEQRAFEGVMKTIESKKGSGAQVIAQNELTAIVDEFKKSGFYDSHALVEWFNKYGLQQSKYTLSGIIDGMQKVIEIQKKRQNDISRINSFYSELVGGMGQVIGEGGNLPVAGKGKTAEQLYKERLEFVTDYIDSQKKLYQEFEDFKYAYGIKRAKELYPNLYNSYEEFLKNLSRMVTDRGEMLIVAGELKNIGAEPMLTAIKPLEAKIDLSKVELELNQKITKERDKQLEIIKRNIIFNEKLNKVLDNAQKIAGIIANDFQGINGEVAEIAFKLAKAIDDFAKLSRSLSKDFGTLGSSNATSSDKAFAAVDIVSKIGAQIAQLVEAIKSMNMMEKQWHLTAAFDAIAFSLDRINRSADADKLKVYQETLEQIAKTGKSLSKDYSDLSMKEIEDAIYKYEELQNSYWFDSKNKNNQAMLDDWMALRDLKLQELEIQNDINELLTGTTSESISDAIAEGFDDGLSSVEDFADMTGKIIRQALVKAFQSAYLDKQLQEWYEQFSADILSGGGLTEQEAAADRKTLEEIQKNASINWESYKKMMEDLGIWNIGESAKGMSGAIKGVTEETAGVLAGQIGAIRINVLEQLEVAKFGLTYQKETAINTRRLEKIETYLGTMIGNTNIITDRTYGR